jgi:hypothetical protein
LDACKIFYQTTIFKELKALDVVYVLGGRGFTPLITSEPSTFGIDLRVRLKTSSRIAELSQHEADGGEFQEGKTAAIEIFPVLGETAAAVEPSDRTLDDPTLG